MHNEKTESKYSAFVDPVCCLVILVVALAIGLVGLSHSGEQWLDDGPRYCNDGAMVHDWLVSDDLLDPVGFAKENYIKYPAHNVPYHPPGYACMLGGWFLTAGMSYASARLFIALCLGGTLCFFYGILRRQGIAPWISVMTTLLLGTSPEIVQWSRSAMSEIPGMLFIVAGSYCFVRYVEVAKARWCWFAFLLAGIAFFCRLSTAGVLPAWFLFLLITKGYRRLLSPHLIFLAIAYLAIGAVWVKFVASVATNEVRQSLTDRLTSFYSIENLSMWIRGLPSMVGWITLVAAICGLFMAFRDQKSRNFACFWFLWFVSCYLFQLALSGHFEARYFVLAVPPICALAGGLLLIKLPSEKWRSVVISAIGLAIATNTYFIFRMPQGLLGYEAVASQLVSQDES
ncbi:glycosyltransferase family 39 protein, partial [Vicingaceae bacterium]|nr:glycosyltransferase family 39 protein [Vicingaceae bacterium]